MYYDEIINLTYEQITNLSDFINTLKYLQSSIVQNDVDEIEIALDQQEKAINRVKICEEKRSDALKAALQYYKIEIDDTSAMDKLADILVAIDPEVNTEFNQIRTILLEKVNEVLLINSQNEIIINSSRIFIRDLIKNILGSKKDNFFDKKV